MAYVAFTSRRHRQTQEEINIRKPRTLLPQDTFRRCAAAWEWLTAGSIDGDGLRIDSARFSRLLARGLVVKKKAGEQQWYASLGHATWGALAWPLKARSAAGGRCQWDFDLNGGVVWLFVTDPTEWVAAAYTGVLSSRGISLQQLGDPEDLLLMALRTPDNLMFEDLVRLGDDVWEPSGGQLPLPQCSRPPPPRPTHPRSRPPTPEPLGSRPTVRAHGLQARGQGTQVPGIPEPQTHGPWGVGAAGARGARTLGAPPFGAPLSRGLGFERSRPPNCSERSISTWLRRRRVGSRP